jgi:hypothetical protein
MGEARRMESLIERDKMVAKKKGTFAAAAWGGTVLLGVAGASTLLILPAAAGAGYLTWKWFHYRAKRGMRF